MKLKYMEAFVVLNMNGFDKVRTHTPRPYHVPCPALPLTPRTQILRKHDVLLGANTRDDFLKTVAWRSVMCDRRPCCAICRALHCDAGGAGTAAGI